MHLMDNNPLFGAFHDNFVVNADSLLESYQCFMNYASYGIDATIKMLYKRFLWYSPRF